MDNAPRKRLDVAWLVLERFSKEAGGQARDDGEGYDCSYGEDEDLKDPGIAPRGLQDKQRQR